MKMWAACIQEPASSLFANLQVELPQTCACTCQGKNSEEQIINRVPTITGWEMKEQKVVQRSAIANIGFTFFSSQRTSFCD